MPECQHCGGEVVWTSLPKDASYPAFAHVETGHTACPASPVFPAPAAADALTFDEAEAAGLDGTLRDVGAGEVPEHCGERMHWYTVGAPGIGGGWWCATCDHQIVVMPTRILGIEDVR
jgi:hypothetical protein